jgi:hypothetical protein
MGISFDFNLRHIAASCNNRGADNRGLTMFDSFTSIRQGEGIYVIRSCTVHRLDAQISHCGIAGYALRCDAPPPIRTVTESTSSTAPNLTRMDDNQQTHAALLTRSSERSSDLLHTPKRARLSTQNLASMQSSTKEAAVYTLNDLCMDGKPLLSGLDDNQIILVQRMAFGLKSSEDYGYKKGLKEGKRQSGSRKHDYQTALDEIARLTREKSVLETENSRLVASARSERRVAAAAMDKVFAEIEELRRRCENAERERNRAVQAQLAEAAGDASADDGSDSEDE